MRQPWLICGLVLSLSACSGASFKGQSGRSDKSADVPPASSDAAPVSPETPPPASNPTPSSEVPNTQNPSTSSQTAGEKPKCPPMGLMQLPNGSWVVDPACPTPTTDETDTANSQNKNQPGQN